jgi:hypothetical protein
MEYGGVDPRAIQIARRTGDVNLKNEATDNIVCELKNRLERLLAGDKQALDLDPIQFKMRKEGITRKVRKIAYCGIIQQIYGHLLILGLEPLLMAKILPTQFACVPKRGAVALQKFAMKKFRKTKPFVKYAGKTDIKNAYGTTNYADIIKIVKREIPSAKWIIALLEALAAMSPDGHLIIGGYPDAWLFNFYISYILRNSLSQTKERRGERKHLISAMPTYADDFGYFGSREADVKKDMNLTTKFCEKRGLTLKLGKIIRLLSFAEEKERRAQTRPSLRACPYFDIGGYACHRGYVTLRKRIFLRVRRQFLRAMEEYKRTQTIGLQRARVIASYYGFFRNSNSKYIRHKLNADWLHRLAGMVISAHDKKINKEVKIYG